MKKLGIWAFTALLMVACNDGGEKKAQERLQLAQQALASQDFSGAKLQIDSIKMLYPKAFEARKAGIRLMQQIDLQEQRKTLAFLDSMLTLKYKQLDAIKGNFTLEKNKEYQDIGNYFYPTQTIEKNLHRSFLRGQVSEQGVMMLTSIYCGPNNIHHYAVKVIAPDGTYAETPSSKDSYETTDLGEKIEKADYKLGDDGGVIAFIAFHKDDNLKVEYKGDRPFMTVISANDRNAIAQVYELALILSSIEQIKKEIKEANLKIEFVTRKMNENQHIKE